jgi:hypothetical protein
MARWRLVEVVAPTWSGQDTSALSRSWQARHMHGCSQKSEGSAMTWLISAVIIGWVVVLAAAALMVGPPVFLPWQR